MYTNIPEPSPRTQADMAQGYETGVGGALVQGIKEGLGYTSIGILSSLVEWGRAGAEEQIDETAWKESSWARKGLKWTPGMTASQAELLAERYDKAQHRAFLWEHSGAAAKTAMVAGDFIGSIPDPLNFIPILRAGGITARALTRLGPRVGPIAIHAAEAAIGVGLYQPAIAYEAGLYQEDFDLQMAALNVAMGAGIGAGFGAIRMSLSRRPPEERLAATAKAVADLIHDRPVDTAPVMTPREAVSERVREFMRDAPEEAPHIAERAQRAELKGRAARRAGTETVEREAGNVGRDAIMRQMASVAGVERADINVVADALDTPRFARSTRQQALLDGLDLMPADERALKVWSTPTAKRTPDDALFLKSYVGGSVPEYLKTRATAIEAKIAELEAKIPETEKQAPVMDAQLAELQKQEVVASQREALLRDKPDTTALREAQTALIASKEELDASIAALHAERDSLVAQREALKLESDGMINSKPLDFSVAERAPVEMPDVAKTTPENAFEPPSAEDADFALMEARYKDMEAQGLLPQEAHEAMAVAAKEGEQMGAMAKAYEIAGLCLMRTD